MRIIKSTLILTFLLFVASLNATELTLNQSEYQALYGQNIKNLQTVYKDHTESMDPLNDAALLKASLIAYRIGPMNLPSKKITAKKYFKDCIMHAKAISPTSNLKAEAFALSAFCYALQINLNPMRAASLGSAYQSSMDTALAFAPNNQHVLLIAAILDSFTPKRYGGDVERGIKRLNKILPQVQKSPKMYWLLPDIHSYLSFSYIKINDLTNAELHLDHARRLVPNYPFLSNIIEPKLQKLVLKNKNKNKNKSIKETG
jgi:hypothetical protein